MSPREPRFDKDYAYGRQGELMVDGLVTALGRGQVRYEVKRKTRLDDAFYVEQVHDPGRTGTYVPSGLATSESDYWCFIVGDTGVNLWVPADLLKRTAAAGYGREAECVVGSCPTRGRLLRLADFLTAAADRRAA